MAPATEAGYAQDWKNFRGWCELSLFVADLLQQGKKVSTVARYAAGVAFTHRRQGFESPLTQSVKDTLWGARRLLSESPRQMRALTVPQLQEISAALLRRGTPVALRDRAVMLVGFATALRRSNLVSLCFSDVEFCEQGLAIKVRREKQDRRGEGRLIGVPFGTQELTCPVGALRAWIGHRGQQPGPLYTRLDYGRRGPLEPLTPNAIYTIVKGAIAAAGIDPEQYGPHSLRAGLITAAGQTSLSHLAIAAQTGHRSLDTLQRYFRPADLFKTNVCTAVGL